MKIAQQIFSLCHHYDFELRVVVLSRSIESKEKKLMISNTPQLELNCLSQVIFLPLDTFFLSHQQWINVFESFKFSLINLLDDTPVKILELCKK